MSAVHLWVQYTVTTTALCFIITNAIEMVGTHDIMPTLAELLQRVQSLADEIDTVAEELFHIIKFVFDMSKGPPT
jgi:hypothetical protein